MFQSGLVIVTAVRTSDYAWHVLMALAATGWQGDKFLWFCSQCCNAFILVCALILMSQGWLCLSCFVTVAWCEFIFGSNKFRTHVYVMYPMHCVLKMIV